VTYPAETIIDQRGSDQDHAEWMQKGWREGYARAFQDIVRILYSDDAWDVVEREAIRLREPPP
jgi:hypothetical protein